MRRMYSENQINSMIENNESKQDKLVSGTNIKTIGGQSVLGSGDLNPIPKIEASGTFSLDVASETAMLYITIKDVVPLNGRISFSTNVNAIDLELYFILDNVYALPMVNSSYTIKSVSTNMTYDEYGIDEITYETETKELQISFYFSNVVVTDYQDEEYEIANPFVETMYIPYYCR